MNEYMRMADRMYDLDNQFEQLKTNNEELKKKNEDLEKKNEQAIKILRNIVYMSNTGLSSKNELAFARLIGEAEQFLQNIYTKSKSSDESKEPQGDWVVRTEEPL